MQVLDLLIKAQDLIRNPAHWGKGVLATDAEGNHVSFRDPSACRFCSLGAISAASRAGAEPEPDPDAEWQAVEALREALGPEPRSVSYFNDTHTHDEVMAMFDKAIASARG